MAHNLENFNAPWTTTRIKDEASRALRGDNVKNMSSKLCHFHNDVDILLAQKLASAAKSTQPITDELHIREEQLEAQIETIYKNEATPELLRAFFVEHLIPHILNTSFQVFNDPRVGERTKTEIVDLLTGLFDAGEGALTNIKDPALHTEVEKSLGKTRAAFGTMFRKNVTLQ